MGGNNIAALLLIEAYGLTGNEASKIAMQREYQQTDEEYLPAHQRLLEGRLMGAKRYRTLSSVTSQRETCGKGSVATYESLRQLCEL